MSGLPHVDVNGPSWHYWRGAQGGVLSLRAAQVPLLSRVEHAGAWRLVVGVSITPAGIVSLRFESWGGVVDYPAAAYIDVADGRVS